MLGTILAVVAVGVIILAIVVWGAAAKALRKTVPLHDCYDSIIHYAKEISDAHSQSGPGYMDRCAALRAAVTGRVQGVDGNDACTKVLPQLPGAAKSPNIPCNAPWQRAIMGQNSCSCAPVSSP